MEGKEDTTKRAVSGSNAVTGYDAIKKIANNVLYFDDNSDYGTALWEILEIVAPEMFLNSGYPDLNYIEES